IRVGLALDRKHDGALVVEPARDLVVLDAVDDARDLVEVDRRAVAIGNDDLAVLLRLGHRARRRQRHALLRAVERSDRRVGVGLGDDVADVVERNVARRGGHRVDLHPHSEFLRAVHQHLRHARQLGNLLRDRDLAVFVDDRQRQGRRDQADIHDREVARIHLAKGGRRRHFHRQLAGGDGQRRLHVERGAVDVAVEFKLYRDRCDAEGRRGGERGDAGDGRELALDRRRHRCRHRFRARARQYALDADGRKVDGRERRDRKQPVGEDTQHDDRGGDQRGEHRPPDAGLREHHGQHPTLGGRTGTLAPFESKSWPLVTTVSTPSSPLSRTDSLPSTRATFTGRTVATSLLTTNTYVPDWLTWIAVDGTVTASSSRNVNPTVTNVPGHSNSSV